MTVLLPMPALFAPVRRFLVGVRDWRDARLHGSRRRRARVRLAELGPRSVLFVCLGNVCRSPYAERVMAARAAGTVRVGSAGFIGPGRAPAEAALRVARARGLEHADHQSRILRREMIEAAGAVFVFDRFNARRLLRTPGARRDRMFWLGDFDPAWAGKRAIIDPWGKSDEEFDATFGRIERCIDDALDALDVRGHGRGALNSPASGTTGRTP